MVRKSIIGAGIVIGALALGTQLFRAVHGKPVYQLQVGQNKTLFQNQSGWHEYAKELSVRSDAVSDDSNILLMVRTQGYKGGRPVEEVHGDCLVQVRPARYYNPQLVAHCLPYDLMYSYRSSRIKPDAIDEVVLTFSPYIPEKTNAVLPKALRLPVTPDLIGAYKDDLLTEKIMTEDRLRESTLKTGVSSGRW